MEVKFLKNRGLTSKLPHDTIAHREIWGKMKHIIIGICIIGFIVGVVLIAMSENARTKNFHLAFSEISQIKKEQGSNLGPITLYYAMINDANMKVFEAYNLSLSPTAPKFAQELEVHIDKTFVHHRHSLPGLLTNISKVGIEALKKLDDLVMINIELKKALSFLRRAWDEDHHDVYHTEYYTETESYTDSKGNTQTRTVTKSREVYDYTIHTYTFRRYESDQGAGYMGRVIDVYPSIRLHENLVSSSMSHADNEFALEKSLRMGTDNNGTIDYSKITNIILGFHRRTTYFINIFPLINKYAEVRNSFPQFNNSRAGSYSTSYRTYSSSDDGPGAFQQHKKYTSMVATAQSLCAEIVEPISMVTRNAQSYYNTITKYIGVVMDSQPGDAGDLKDMIVGTAENWQNANFKGTFNLHNSFRIGWFMLKLLGIIVLCGLPIAWYKFWYDEF